MEKMNLVCIPYHDWRKIEEEGARTRDAHIIGHLEKQDIVDKLLIINRPITHSEIIIKKKKKKISGEKIYSYKQSSLYKISPKLYVLDYFSNDLLGPVIHKRKWFFDAFEEKKLQEAYEKAISFLKIQNSTILTQNIFSAKFIAKNFNQKRAFDAWDNFALFPSNSTSKSLFEEAYHLMAKSCNTWFTNSDENIVYYKEHYNPKECILVKNGVDINKFSTKYPLPDDMKNIPHPIVGFGGKISHLVDYQLINYLTKKNPDKSFVFVGQILDKDVFNKIEKTTNVFYLGDKNYSQYPAYVTNFDIGIVPYVVKKLQHGGDSMKVYEYLAAGLNVIGVPAGGMQDLSSYIYLANSAEEFSQGIENAVIGRSLNNLPNFYTWNFKVKEIIKILNEI
jgi:hypothetical protein